MPADLSKVLDADQWELARVFGPEAYVATIEALMEALERSTAMLRRGMAPAGHKSAEEVQAEENRALLRRLKPEGGAMPRVSDATIADLIANAGLDEQDFARYAEGLARDLRDERTAHAETKRRLDEAVERLYDLMDGLDANAHDGGGLTQAEWDKRVAESRAFLATLEDK